MLLKSRFSIDAEVLGTQAHLRLFNIPVTSGSALALKHLHGVLG